ncbi:GGDEF domain-containing protein [Vibrio paucivorans]
MSINRLHALYSFKMRWLAWLVSLLLSAVIVAFAFVYSLDRKVEQQFSYQTELESEVHNVSTRLLVLSTELTEALESQSSVSIQDEDVRALMEDKNFGFLRTGDKQGGISAPIFHLAKIYSSHAGRQAQNTDFYYRGYLDNSSLVMTDQEVRPIRAPRNDSINCQETYKCTRGISSLGDRFIISKFYKDILTGKQVLTVSTPVIIEGELIADLSSDIFLSQDFYFHTEDTGRGYINVASNREQGDDAKLYFSDNYIMSPRAIMESRVYVMSVLEDDAVWLAVLFVVSVALVRMFGFAYARYLRSLAAELESQKDELTGVYTKSYIRKFFLNGGKISNAAVLFVDGNGIKKINDSFGHKVGDLAIQHIAKTIKDNVKSTDWIIRYGGDEFLIIANDMTSEEELQVLIERIKGHCSEGSFMIHGTKITSSVGGCLVDEIESYQQLEEFVALSDHRMYEDKKAYKNSNIERLDVA